ncbi:hypothetical protein SDC9_121168 [bioreactor metagenome]|uniref:4Fe-4S Mo/W bis-MGD-type domain-containing protein n=1 Tax=bioreactor metagenome TaxID=1076179 RepID=A0A645CB74_9ZZZZ|nr:DUF1667 domain-containing protein [Christensenella sp.]
MTDSIDLSIPRVIVCIVCPNGCRIHCEGTEDGVRFTGQKCKRGESYAAAELTRPMRSLTTSVRTAFAEAPVVSVRTDGEVEKSMLQEISSALGQIVVTSRVKIGDVIAKNICGTGVNVICTSDRLVHPY